MSSPKKNKAELAETVRQQVQDFARTQDISQTQALVYYLVAHFGVATTRLSKTSNQPILALTGSAAAKIWFPDWRSPEDVDVAQQWPTVKEITMRQLHKSVSRVATYPGLVFKDYFAESAMAELDDGTFISDVDLAPVHPFIFATAPVPLSVQWADLPTRSELFVETPESLLMRKLALLANDGFGRQGVKALFDIHGFKIRGVDIKTTWATLSVHMNQALKDNLPSGIQAAIDGFSIDTWGDLLNSQLSSKQSFAKVVNDIVKDLKEVGAISPVWQPQFPPEAHMALGDSLSL